RARLTPSGRRAPALRPPARPAHPAAKRCGSFDLRRGEADHHRVADFEVAVDHRGEAAVADSGADLDRLQFLVRVEVVAGLRAPPWCWSARRLTCVPTRRPRPASRSPPRAA